MMAVVLAAFGERLGVCIVRSRIEHARILAVAGDAFALQIDDVFGERRRAELETLMANDPGHHDNAPGGRLHR